MTTTITLRKNGPILVEGEFALQDSDGKPVAMLNPNKIFLCRCGASAKKPFCDGAHKSCGFTDDLPQPQSQLQP